MLPGAVSEVNLPSRCRTARRGTPEERIALLRQACEEILLLLAFDPFPRFVRSPSFLVMLNDTVAREILSGRIERVVTSTNDTEEIPSDLDLPTGDHLNARIASCFSESSVDAYLGNWLQRFVAMAELLPACITLAKACSARSSLLF